MKNTSTQQYAIGQRVIYNGCGALELAVIQDIKTSVTGVNLPRIERIYQIAGDGWELGTTADSLEPAEDKLGNTCTQIGRLPSGWQFKVMKRQPSKDGGAV